MFNYHNINPSITNIICCICILSSIILLGTSLYAHYSYTLSSILEPAITEDMPDKIELLTPASNSSESNNIKLYANSACLTDAASGRILYSKNETEPMPMASTTKIMTCILALESGMVDEPVTVSAYAASMPDVQLNIRENEQYIMRDLLYSLMLESHNDTAVAIAEHISGTVESFANLMNEKAIKLGCTDTEFVTPNGLDKGNHHSTAKDMCIIASYAIQNSDFLNIIQTPSYNFKDISRKRTFTVNNHDSFLNIYNGAIGIKTGFTVKAGYCFVGAATREGTTLISTVLASGWPPNKSYKWSDTTSLMDYGFNTYKMKALLSGIINLPPLPVIDNTTRYYCCSNKKILSLSLSAEYSLPVCSTDKAVLTFELPPYVSSPIKKGEAIGNACLIVNDELLKEYPILASDSISLLEYSDYLSIIIDTFLS